MKSAPQQANLLISKTVAVGHNEEKWMSSDEAAELHRRSQIREKKLAISKTES